jgi:cation diffusion facilitator CzcD-associated flavoprotein CzcO
MTEQPTLRACDVAVVGAGPAGLATAAMLRREGIDDVVVVDRAPYVAASWRTRYDGFILNTSRWFSYLPGCRFPRAAGRWPSRDAVVDYLERYAERNELELELGTVVELVDRADGGWRLSTPRGDIAAAVVVIAIGRYHSPVIPPWPGCESFRGELIHSSEYRSAGPFRGRDVLVVGAGNTGSDIVVQLASDATGRTRLSVRTPPHLVPREIGPLPIDAFGVLMRHWPPRLVDAVARVIRFVVYGDLTSYGLPSPQDGIYTHVIETERIPTVDGPLVRALRERRVEVVAAVAGFEGDEVVLVDGSRIAPQVVIAATGYRRGLAPLVGHLGVLSPDGAPLVSGPQTAAVAENLYFAGQLHPFSGPLREFRLESRKIARAVAGRRAAPARVSTPVPAPAAASPRARARGPTSAFGHPAAAVAACDGAASARRTARRRALYPLPHPSRSQVRARRPHAGRQR